MSNESKNNDAKSWIKPSIQLRRLGKQCREINVEATERYNDQVSLLIAKKQLYADLNFFPSENSLYGRGRLRGFGPNYKWRRITPAIQGGSVFGSSIEAIPNPNDIKQGALGDCYLLSALSALALVPGAVEDLFMHSVLLNPQGIYQLRFFMNGVWQIISVDDLMPVDSNDALVYSSCLNTDKIWVPLIEKAYAKFHGSYHTIAAGTVTQALQELTGAPCREYNIDQNKAPVDMDLMWTLLLSSIEHQYIVCAGAGGSEDAQLYSAVGLQQNHAYAILKVVTVDQRHRLLQIRNPWAKFIYNSDWNETSPKWTNAIKQEIGLSDEELHAQGVFWMTWEEFLTFFRSISICRVVRQAFQHSFMSQIGSQHMASTIHQFQVNKPTWTTFSMLSPCQRGYTPAPHKYVDIGLMIVRSSVVPAPSTAQEEHAAAHSYQSDEDSDEESNDDDDDDEALLAAAIAMSLGKTLVANQQPVLLQEESTEKTSTTPAAVDLKTNKHTMESIVFPKAVRDIDVEVFLMPGFQYTVFPFSLKAKPNTPFVLSMYAQHPVEEIETHDSATALFTAKLHDAIRAKATVQEPTLHVKIYTAHVEHTILILVENVSDSLYTACLFDFSLSKGLQYSRGDSKCRDVLPPKTAMIIQALSVEDQYAGFSLGQRCAFKQGTQLAIEHFPQISKEDSLHEVVHVTHG